MRYLVTGAGGFVGRYLTRSLLEGGHEVTGLVRRPGTLASGVVEVVADLLDRDQVVKVIEDVKPDGIFHLAAPETSVGRSWQDPATTISGNLDSAVSVFEASRRLAKPAKILFVSSAEVIGQAATAQPADETIVPQPDSPYAVSKQFGEEAARLYTAQLATPIIIVRPFNHIGPGQRPTFAIPGFARQIAELEAAGAGELKVGNLKARRDFTDVRDMVEAYQRLIDRGEPGQTYHAGSGTASSIQEILAMMIDRSPATIKVVTDKTRLRPTDIPVLACDPTAIRQLGWRPRIPLEQTVADILTAARDQQSKRK